MAKAKKAAPKKATTLKFPKTGKTVKAKAKAPKAAKAKKPATKATTLSAAAAKAAAQAKHATPRSKPLPGFEQVVDEVLNRICERISDNRAALNDLRQEIDGDSQAALDHMLRKQRQTYHHAGVELVVRPGAAKLSVRTFKEEGATANMPEGDNDEVTQAESDAADLGMAAVNEAAADVNLDDEGVDDVTTH